MLRIFYRFLLLLGISGLLNGFLPGISAFAQQEAQQEAQPVQRQAQGTLPGVLAVRVSNTPERARVIVDLEAGTAFSFVSLADPMAIAIDVRSKGLAQSLAQTSEGVPAGDGMIDFYSVQLLGTERVRTLLMLKAPMQVQQAYVLDPFDDQPARLVVDLIADSADRFAARADEDLATSRQIAPLQTSEQSSNAPGTTLQQAQSRPLILIDPGHGGVDNGAQTPNGIQEKTITLAFAKRLQEILIASGQFDVALSRDDDSFMRLEQRVQLARTNKADLFISLHADIFEDTSIRGASVYTRDEQASDVLDKVLAEQENRADLLAGFEVPVAETAVVNILVDLMRREMRRQSYIAAQAIIDQLKPSVRIRRYPLRRADFFVLQSPDVPSILLELGFLSNIGDARNLTSPDWRGRVAEAVARGIALYFGKSNR